MDRRRSRPAPPDRPFDSSTWRGNFYMGKRKDELPGAVAEAFGVGKLTRHLFICIGPDCVA